MSLSRIGHSTVLVLWDSVVDFVLMRYLFFAVVLVAVRPGVGGWCPAESVPFDAVVEVTTC